jgi:lipid A 3-O-deacylase
MFRSAIVLVLGAVVALAPRPAFAQPPAWTFLWENDVVFGSDDDYTNGLRLSADFSKALWWKRWGLGYENCGDQTDASKPCLRTTLMFGQNFYTPHDITVKQVQEGERPYAAWLYGGVAGRISRPTRLTSVELQIGTTGKAALGKDVQTWFHSLPGMNSPRPKGWNNQVKPVPGVVGVVASWDDRFAIQRKTQGESPFVYADAIPYYRLTVGNVHTNAAIGTALRLGYNIQGWGTEKIAPTIRACADPCEERHLTFNGFAAVEARAVAWNALLQHETYTPRQLPSISRVVSDVEAGFEIGYCRLTGGFRWVSRSPEFDGGRDSRFGSLFIRWAPIGS